MSGRRWDFEGWWTILFCMCSSPFLFTNIQRSSIIPSLYSGLEHGCPVIKYVLYGVHVTLQKLLESLFGFIHVIVVCWHGGPRLGYPVHFKPINRGFYRKNPFRLHLDQKVPDQILIQTIQAILSHFLSFLNFCAEWQYRHSSQA